MSFEAVNIAPYLLEINKSVDEQTNFKVKHVTFKDRNYVIMRYNKSLLSKDAYNTTGLIRSVICKDNEIVCYSPPKSIDYTMFKNQVSPSNITSIEEYVEGTMINLFWTGDTWEIATRSSVGGNVSFFSDDNSDGMSFRHMFLDTIASQETSTQTDFFSSFENMPKNFCFSFVLQHPNNRIVVPFINPSLYLVKVYEMTNGGYVNEINISSVANSLPGWVKYPEQIHTSLTELEQSMLSDTSDHNIVGAMIYGIIDGTVVRTKIRNSTYETVRRLRGNQPKLKYQYLMLRREGNITEYLKYYPEHKQNFFAFRNQVHSFTLELYSLYVSCYIMRSGPLINFSIKYRNHMFNLHQLYKIQPADIKKSITKTNVIDYVNNLHPSILMHSINIAE